MRHALRSLTSETHDELDRLVGATYLRDPVDLGGLLHLHASALPRIVAGLQAADVVALFPAWDEPPRISALRDDLGTLMMSFPQTGVPARFANQAEMTGALYTIMGSRLGNRMIARHPALQAATATRFLTYGSPKAWPEFLEWLDRTADEHAVDHVAAGARTAFDVYLQAARAAGER